MARIEIDPNYSSPTFSRATAATDLFKKEDVQAVASALSTHDHSTGKGLPVAALQATTVITGGGTLTWPTISATMVGRATTDTLTNKTLTAPSMTTVTISSGGLGIGAAPQAGVPLALSGLGSGSTAIVVSGTPANLYGIGLNTGELALVHGTGQFVGVRDGTVGGTLGIAFAAASPAVIIGSSATAQSGHVRLPNNSNIGWRDGGNTGNILLGFDTTNRLQINGATAITNTASAGANALPASPFGFWRVMFDGVEKKIPVYNV